MSRQPTPETQASPWTASHSSLILPADFNAMVGLSFWKCSSLRVYLHSMGSMDMCHYPTRWLPAQRHWTEHHAHLSPITEPWVEEGLKNAAKGKFEGGFWIGLYRNVTEWKWSGGGSTSHVAWYDNEPDDNKEQWVGSICWHKCNWSLFFLLQPDCGEVWEEATECRRNHNALTSLVSDTQNLLALRKIQDDPTTELVWIGLRFLGDRWLWVSVGPSGVQGPAQGRGPGPPVSNAEPTAGL